MDETRVETVLQEHTVGGCKTHRWMAVEPDLKSELISIACSECGLGGSVSRENLPQYLEA